MAYLWEEIKRAVERVEDVRMEHWLAKAEADDGYRTRGSHWVRGTRKILESLGALILGLHVAVMTLLFNYVLFVWLLHVNFDF